jgi:CheY-like chemotaxis protein
MSQIYPQTRHAADAESNTFAEHSAEAVSSSFEVFSRACTTTEHLSEKRRPSLREIPCEDLLKSILLVSSDDRLRSMLRSYLESLGYLVFSCTDTHQASQLFHSGTAVDLLLADLHLLGPSALELAEEITEEDRDLRVILLTGPSTEDVVLSRIRQSGWGFQSKPVLLPYLFALIQEVLGKQHHRSQRSGSSKLPYQTHIVSFPITPMPTEKCAPAAVRDRGGSSEHRKREGV